MTAPASINIDYNHGGSWGVYSPAVILNAGTHTSSDYIYIPSLGGIQNSIKCNKTTFAWADNNTSGTPGDVITSGNYVYLGDNHDGTSGVAASNFTTFRGRFEIPAGLSSGPTVTSITRNESNNLITVLHTGTLTSTDVNHTISNVSSSITNLQTVSNGSTFTANGNNGTHVIKIGNKLITYFINDATERTIMSSNNNLTVSFPTTDSAWLSNFSAYDSGTLTFIKYLDTKTAVRLAVDNSFDYFMWVTFNLSYNSTQGGFSVLTQIYDYRGTYTYSPTLQWVYPETTFESTGSANTLITLPTNEIVDSFNWNFASVVAQAATTSNGGGKPDRYPLIMTNLFNRNRSIYSIGMTHKDTWDLFL